MQTSLKILALALLSLPAFAQNPGVTRFGVEPAFAPFEMKLPNGKLAGFDIEIGEALCAQMGTRCQWVENSFDSMIPALLAKKFDGILSSYSMTEQRKKQVAFTDKLFHTPQVLVVKKGSGLKATAESLRGKTVGVAQGSSYEAFAKKHWATKGVNVVAYQSSDLARADLVNGRLDGVADNAVVFQENFLKKPEGIPFGFAEPAIKDDAIFSHGAAIGLRKEDVALLKRLNQAIADIRKNGTYDRIAKKYFTFDPYDN
jgi:lysine/arginine/ornithine transport system substrate-binding protein